MPQVRAAAAVAAVTVSMIAAADARAGLVADYQFQGRRLSSVGTAPPLADFGATQYTIDTVGSCATSVLSFPKHDGLRLDGDGLPDFDGSFTVEITARLDEVSEYRKLLGQPTGEAGLYVHNGKLDHYDQADTDTEGGVALAAGKYARITLTVDRSLEDFGPVPVKAYVDGVLQFSRSIGSPAGLALTSDTWLFRDENGGGDEDSGGAVSRIRVFDQALAQNAIQGGPEAPTCLPEPVPDPSLESTIVRHPKAKTRSRKARFEFSSNSPTAAFECSLDGRPFSGCTSPRLLRVKRGRHLFKVRAREFSGAIDPDPAAFEWKVKRKRGRR